MKAIYELATPKAPGQIRQNMSELCLRQSCGLAQIFKAISELATPEAPGQIRPNVNPPNLHLNPTTNRKTERTVRVMNQLTELLTDPLSLKELLTTQLKELLTNQLKEQRTFHHLVTFLQNWMEQLTEPPKVPVKTNQYLSRVRTL